MAVNIALVIGAEWASDERFMREMRKCGHKDFLISYFNLDNERKRAAAVEFVRTHECQPISNRKKSAAAKSTKRREPTDG